ncbi:MAG: hypothetical protein ACOH5I_18230 [Oligoflexus sp.]
MKRTLHYLIISLFLANPLLADGTLPFGDGTLPFGMAGRIIELANGQESGEQALEVYFDRRSSSSPIVENTPCPRPMSWYRVGGQIELGRNLLFSIQGVCATGSATGQRLIEARRGADTLRLEGNLRANPMNGMQSFQGTATLTSSRGTVLQSFRFDLSE